MTLVDLSFSHRTSTAVSRHISSGREHEQKNENRVTQNPEFWRATKESQITLHHKKGKQVRYSSYFSRIAKKV